MRLSGVLRNIDEVAAHYLNESPHVFLENVGRLIYRRMALEILERLKSSFPNLTR